MNDVSLQDLLLIEDDASILEFRCAETGIPIWTQMRSEVFRMMVSDIFYPTAQAADASTNTVSSQALATMSRALFHNLRLRFRGRCRADVCLVATGVGNQLLNGKWLNRLSDHFALACYPETIVIEGHFEWRWPVPRHNERILYGAPLQAADSIRRRLFVRDAHRRQAESLLNIVLDRAKQFVGWTPNVGRKETLIERFSGKIAALPRQYNAHKSLLTRIRPKMLIVEEACYGNTASLIAAGQRMNIVTAEYQHGVVSAGHQAYNFAPTIRESLEYRETLPEHFLGYGQWWNDQINAPLTKTAIGNPHRDAALAQTLSGNQRKGDILILSDGLEFPMYLDLAKQIASSDKNKGLRVVLRAHPEERSQVRAKYGDRVGDVLLDYKLDFYTSLRSAHVVISEISTGLFEAAGLADKIFVWDTPKARYTIPQHPFKTFSSVSMFLDLLGDEKAGRLSASDVDGIWSPSWYDNYLRFLKDHCVHCTGQRPQL
jgi:hypothetical protein